MATQQRGTITAWNDDRGFGFITPEGGGPTIFFHVSAFVHRHVRPSINSAVFYTLTHDQQQRPRATDVRLSKAPPSKAALTLAIVASFFLLLVLATYFIPLTPWIVIAYSLSSLVTCGLYASDKASAIQGTQRVSESTLHVFEFLGGWPGALIARQYYRQSIISIGVLAAGRHESAAAHRLQLPPICIEYAITPLFLWRDRRRVCPP